MGQVTCVTVTLPLEAWIFVLENLHASPADTADLRREIVKGLREDEAVYLNSLSTALIETVGPVPEAERD